MGVVAVYLNMKLSQILAFFKETDESKAGVLKLWILKFKHHWSKALTS